MTIILISTLKRTYIFLLMQLSPKHKNAEFDEIVFCEFLELLAAVALLSNDDGDEVGKKIRLAFNTIALIQPPARSEIAKLNKK